MEGTINMSTAPIGGLAQSKPLAVHMSLEDQMACVADFANTVSILEDRLRPVRNLSPEAAQKDGGIDRPAPISIADRVQYNTRALRILNEKLMKVIDSLEV